MTLKKAKIIGDYDEFDLMILDELRKDCDVSVRQLAKKTGLHPNTLMQRIKRLEDDKVIVKYTADIDYSKLGYDFHALVMIKVVKGAGWSMKLTENLISIPEITALYNITGENDITAIVRTRNRDELTNVISKILSIDWVSDTNTHLVLRVLKHSYEYNPFGSMLRYQGQQ